MNMQMDKGFGHGGIVIHGIHILKIFASSTVARSHFFIGAPD
jgi:hypothetical protein